MFRIHRAREFVGQEVVVRGWVLTKRSSGKIWFAEVRDGSGIMQCVAIKGQTPEPAFELYDRLTLECSVELRGVVREEKRAPGGYELFLLDGRVVGPSASYPIPKIGKGEEPPEVGKLLPLRHLWIRSRRQWAILRIRAEVIRAICDYLDSAGFTRFDAPIITGAAVEGTTTLFPLDYFGERAYLSQSAQLYEEAGAYALGRVYSVGPTFRAEKSKTRRHLTEFWQIEPEAAWMEFPELLELIEGVIAYTVERVLERRAPELRLLGRDIAPLERATERPYPRIRYAQAVELLRDAGMEFEFGQDFGGDEETVISKAFDKPVMVTHYPVEIKPFYMKPDPQNPNFYLNVDVLAPEGYGEIVGGSQREEDPDVLLARMRQGGMTDEEIAAYRWYLEIRRYGRVPTSGFGIGIERTVAWIAGIRHVREAIPFPRMLERLYP